MPEAAAGSFTGGDRPVVEVAGLSFRFAGSEYWALRDVDLTIHAGEFVVVAGPSGSGKSTLALALGGYVFDGRAGEVAGTVRVVGLDASRTPLFELADAVGLVQQNPESQLCTLTVADEVAFGLENRELPRAEIAERIEWALGVVGGRQLLGRAIGTLSGGEQQRVAVAAAIAARPRVLILDEPTSNLDPASTAEVLRCLDTLRQEAGLTLVVVEHKLAQLLPYEPRLVVLAGGRVALDGPAATVVADRRQELDGLGVRLPGLVRRAFPGARLNLRTSPSFPAAKCERPAPCVLVEDLRVERGGRSVLDGLSLRVEPGEFVTILGDNGSGKTTLLLTLLGLLKPAGGRVQTLGHDVARTPVSAMAREVGFVFQNPEHQLFCDSVLDEATFARRNLGLADAAGDDLVRELLVRVGLDDRRDAHPYRLSYGQKRRLNLVSVLGHRPSLILLDEPLIGQDWSNARFLLEFLNGLRRDGVAVVLVGHDPEIAAATSDRLVFLRHGRVLVDASPESAFARLREIGALDFLPPAEAGESPAGEERR